MALSCLGMGKLDHLSLQSAKMKVGAEGTKGQGDTGVSLVTKHGPQGSTQPHPDEQEQGFTMDFGSRSELEVTCFLAWCCHWMCCDFHLEERGL